MPALGSAFALAADRATAAASALEVARIDAPIGSLGRQALTPARIQYVYEAAFLRTFASWETLLEESSLRYVCGYSTAAYAPSFPPGISAASSITNARSRLFGAQPFLLWHDPTRNVNRVKGWVSGCPVEVVCSTGQTWLELISYVRHRIAHRSDDARSKFDHATMTLAGRRVPGASVGQFLRMIAPSGQRWLVELTDGLKGLALQVAP